MAEYITVARSWNELNDWQLQEISHLYLNTPIDDFAEAYGEMILIVYQKSPDLKARLELKRLTANVPITELAKYTEYLKDKNDLYRFPEIPGVIKPADKIENISARQFSTIDTYFFKWNKERTSLNLKRLVATLYRLNDQYDDLDLRSVSMITDKIPEKQMEAIALAYMFTRRNIEERFPIVFPKTPETDQEKLQPVFKKKENTMVPFDKALLAMAMDELQPLGKKQDVNNVRIYEFLSVMSESIVYHKAKQKSNEGK
ncbi:hypothetical protein [Chryseobacterium arthrosphaerae]|uniref:hypothetical protein n=1 Tax=Chryseobacterium arthrosphaerae TaxID=651561 RepID=UPI00241EA25B|nr:hypothetical protein [Chryseobacterium arthrosphaerae]